jgi:hypothetical protein
LQCGQFTRALLMNQIFVEQIKSIPYNQYVAHQIFICLLFKFHNILSKIQLPSYSKRRDMPAYFHGSFFFEKPIFPVKVVIFDLVSCSIRPRRFSKVIFLLTIWTETFGICFRKTGKFRIFGIFFNI